MTLNNILKIKDRNSIYESLKNEKVKIQSFWFIIFLKYLFLIFKS
jgi:hypothetical protein